MKQNTFGCYLAGKKTVQTDLEDDSVSSLSDLLDLEEVVELGGRLGHAGHLCFSGV